MMLYWSWLGSDAGDSVSAKCLAKTRLRARFSFLHTQKHTQNFLQYVTAVVSGRSSRSYMFAGQWRSVFQCHGIEISACQDPHRTPTPRFVRWDSGLPIRCDLLVRSLLPAACERSHMKHILKKALCVVSIGLHATACNSCVL